jgi:hypothetical protein
VNAIADDKWHSQTTKWATIQPQATGPRGGTLQPVLQLILLRSCSLQFKELEIVVLRLEVAVFRRGIRRPSLTIAR